MGPGAPPLFLDQTEAQRAKKIFWETAPPFLRVWMTPPPALSAVKALQLEPLVKDHLLT